MTKLFAIVGDLATSIWKCIIELHLCIQMELKFPDLFIKNLPDGAGGGKCWLWSKLQTAHQNRFK